MPDDWRIEETHEDLLRRTLCHDVLWEDGILMIDSFKKARLRPGLAFSGGVDSVMPCC